MAKMEMMYGVTIPETGVSRFRRIPESPTGLVGVKLDEVETV